TLFTLGQLSLIPSYWLLSLSVYGIIYFMSQNQLESLLDDAVIISEELKKFRVASKYLEEYPYGQNQPLRKHCQIFLDDKNKPSTQLKRITVMGTAIGLRMNPLLRIFLNTVVPWDFFAASRLETLKGELAANLQVWLGVLFELEAILSLANFSYLNPGRAFPEILETPNAPPALHAQQLGHPLIPDAQKKTNDFSLKKTGDIALVTGSNMSGKSTFLKTVGVNLCLAFAGGPVDAKSLKTTLFRMFSCIKINDSVTDGFSFFYAEVKRLKALLNELESDKLFPVLFLIDEIFKGTNNRERLIGSRSYIKTLVGKRGLGIITTHDLELTQLADKIPSVINYHFREDVVNGEMVFDYKMRPGPCPSTNALKIMQLEGLPVEEMHSINLDEHKRAS
ncbi:MAG: MutS family DNA mismatch repair protein, partial [bacterium]